MNDLVRQFHERHGPECYQDRSWIYYPDGAQREVDPLGALLEPPDPNEPTGQGEYQLAANKLRFAQLKLKSAVDHFDELNTHLAHSIPQDPAAALADLNQRGKLVQSRKRLVAEAEAALENTRWANHQRQAREAEAERMRKFVEFQQARSKVRV